MYSLTSIRRDEGANGLFDMAEAVGLRHDMAFGDAVPDKIAMENTLLAMTQ